MDIDFAKHISETFDIEFTKEISNLIFSFDLEISFKIYFDNHVKTNFEFIMKINYQTFYDEIICDFEKHSYKDNSDSKISIDWMERKILKEIIKETVLVNMFDNIEAYANIYSMIEDEHFMCCL